MKSNLSLLKKERQVSKFREENVQTTESFLSIIGLIIVSIEGKTGINIVAYF